MPMTEVRPEPKDRVIVRDGTPWKYDAKPTRHGALGVVLKCGVSAYTSSGLVHECWLLIDGDCSPTILWSNQFELIAQNTQSDKVFWTLANKWIEKFKQ